MRQHVYYVYILTNPSKSSLYTGVTNDMRYRLNKHREGAAVRDTAKYTGLYNCIHVLYFETFQWIQDAIAREKEIKSWTRAKKLELIRGVNAEMRFLEGEYGW